MTTPLPKNSFRRKRGVSTRPRRNNVRDARRITLPQRVVYSDTDRIGSYRPDGDRFIAFDRRLRTLGSFETRDAALAAIRSGGKS